MFLQNPLPSVHDNIVVTILVKYKSVKFKKQSF